MITLKLNGQDHPLDVTEDMPLLWAIRDVAGYNGTKFGCGMGLVTPAGDVPLGGVGEPDNAIFAATSQRIRSLPVRYQLQGWQEARA